MSRFRLLVAVVMAGALGGFLAVSFIFLLIAASLFRFVAWLAGA
jgi:hypothetical protein